jgi:tRNA pseudouridine55 synthase
MSTPIPSAGLLLLDKPLGLSSNAALQRIRRLCGRIKAGHSGSLDPLASGMLPICLGAATRLAGELLAGRKCYLFTLKLGERSATGDAEGAIIERRRIPELTPAAIEAVLSRHRGAGVQVPPMYSALKRDGRPLYALARAGIEVPREPRPIRLDALELCAAPDADRLSLRVLCSGGTYVRVLAETLAEELGTCGHVVALRRTFVEPFEQEPMWSFQALEERLTSGEPLPVLAADRAVSHLPALELEAGQALALRQGRRVPAAAAPDTLWRLYEAQEFLGLGVTDGQGDLRVRRLFPQVSAAGAAEGT